MCNALTKTRRPRSNCRTEHLMYRPIARKLIKGCPKVDRRNRWNRSSSMLKRNRVTATRVKIAYKYTQSVTVQPLLDLKCASSYDCVQWCHRMQQKSFCLAAGTVALTVYSLLLVYTFDARSRVSTSIREPVELITAIDNVTYKVGK